MSNQPRYIIWHTAAHGNKGRDYDTTAREIDDWHKQRSFRCIGYHYVIRKSGAVEPGRSEWEVGAHALGLNGQSIGVCFSGHADISEHTLHQREAGIVKTLELMRKYNIPVEHVIGHNEINRLIAAGFVNKRYAVNKTCPGKLVDMNDVRGVLSKRLLKGA